MAHYLAIDIGASSGRHIVGWREDGKIVMDEVYRFANGADSLNDSLVWDIERIFSEVKSGIIVALTKYPDIVSLSIDTWAVDYVLMRGDEPVMPCFAYRDGRTAAVIGEVHKIVPFAELYERMGIQFQPFNTVYQLYTDKLAGRLEGVTDFLMLPEYLMWRLTGVKVKEYTNATTTGLVNAKSRQYDKEIIERLGLPQWLFGKLLMPGTVVENAFDSSVCVVLCATHDTASAVEGIPMGDDALYLSSGTWSLLGVKLPAPLTDERSRASNFTNEGGVGYVRYLKNIDGLYPMQQLQKELGISFDEMVELARNADTPVGAQIDGIYRNLVQCYKKVIAELERNTGRTWKKLYIVGGGAKDGYLTELTRLHTGKEVIALPIEATALGNLKIQIGSRTMSSFEHAKNKYAGFGVDVENALEYATGTSISIHCWQGDDVNGFDGGGADGGIQATGNYPGKARNFEELTADFRKACSLIPGKKRINLHASYAVFENGEKVDRDTIEYRHFAPWVDFAREMSIGIDFNPTCFGHAKVKDGLTLSSPDEATRRFWIEHCKRSRSIANEIGEQLNDNVLCNVWIPDGLKDVPADRLNPRLRLKAALDEIFAEDYPHIIDCVESKVFGIGLESYTVGSNEFYISYTAGRKGVYPLIDNGHFHPTENVADKIAALAPFFDYLPLHVTRPVRWDSDHVVLFNDELREMFGELVNCNALSKAKIGLDFFDASINRIAAWVIGTRSAQKALLYALLQPSLAELQNKGDFTHKMAVMEDVKTLPFGDVWEEYCKRQGVPANSQTWFRSIERYESDVLSCRA
jgi:L-rhamnose isomerase